MRSGVYWYQAAGGALDGADGARRGVHLTSIGFGLGNYNDVLLEKLADQWIEEAERRHRPRPADRPGVAQHVQDKKLKALAVIGTKRSPMLPDVPTVSEAGLAGYDSTGWFGVVALDYLRDLNEATQSVHWVKPSAHAMIGWRYTVVDRATLTDTSSDATVDETDPPADFAGARYTHEALENTQTVPWQGYELGPLAPDHYWIDGLNIVAQASRRPLTVLPILDMRTKISPRVPSG